MSLTNKGVTQSHGRYKEFDFTINCFDNNEVIEIRHSKGLINTVYEKIKHEYYDGEINPGPYFEVSTGQLKKEALARGFVLRDLEGLKKAILRTYETMKK
jgi:hypothetical protein